MATILRSSRYIRCLNVFTRRIVVAHDNGNIASKSLVLQAQCINSYLTKGYATVPAIQRKDTHSNFDKHLARLDENVQRYGRVFKTEVEDVLSKIRRTGFIQSLDGLLLIRCCGDLMIDTIPTARNQLALDIWNTLETLKIPMDVSHFNALLRVYLENDYEFSPIEILTKMKDKGIEPNRVTYQRLILHNCKKGDIAGATKILEFMREKGLPLNESVFTALIIGHSEANDMESAHNILNVMKDAGVAPSSSTYTALLSAYAKRGDMESINKTIAECGTKELYLQDKEFFEVVHILAGNGYINEIDEMLSLMPKGPTYNYDACHAILKVLDVGSVKAGLKILSTMKRRKISEEESEENDSGTFLIRKMVNAKYPVNEIVEACEHLEQQGHHGRAFFVALERSLLNADTELSIPLLKACTERNVKVREHYLWPLLVAHGKASNYQGIEDTLKVMTSDLKVMPGIETITDYVLPFTVGKWDDIVNTLREYRIPHDKIVTSIAVRMLLDKKTRKTAAFMANYPSRYDASAFHRPLADALRDTQDAQSFVTILRLLHAYTTERPTDSSNEPAADVESNDYPHEDLISYVVQKAIAGLQFRRQTVGLEMIDCLIEKGMSLSQEAGNQLREFFKDTLTAETSPKIDKLTSGTLVMTPIEELQPPSAEINELSGGSQDGPAMSAMQFGRKRQQLNSCLMQGDVVGLKAVTEELEKVNFIFSPGVFAQIIDVYCNAEDLKEAERWVNKLKTVHPDAGIDLQKSTAYATLLVKNNRFDDALQFILNSPRTESTEPTKPGLRRLVKTVVDTVAETGNVENTQTMFDALVSMNYMNIDSFVLGSLIKVHLVRNDLEAALDAFENLCTAHRCTPYKNELSRRFIDAEDANSLQRLTDLSTQIHGERNSLVDLVLAFIECGRLRQARKILETPGLRVRSGKLKAVAERYIEDDKNQYLDQFVEMTKGLPILDRQELYEILLDAYCRKNDWQRGLSLWTEMQEEDHQPSQHFMDKLAELLRKEGKQVPFTNSTETYTAPAKAEPDYVADFNAAIERGNLDVAEKIIYNAPGNHTDFSTVTSTLIEKVLEQRNDTDKAVELMEMLLVKFGRWPRATALKMIWNSLIKAEKYQQLRDLDKIMSSSIKRKFRYQKYLNRATLKEAGADKFLSDFEAKLTDSKKDNLTLVKEHMHFTTLLEEVKKNPSLLAKLTPLAERLAKQEIHLPINLIWCYYFEQNNPEADEIWSKYLRHSTWVVFSYILDVAKKNNDVELLKRLHDKLQENLVVSPAAMSSVATHLAEVYAQNGRHEEALNVLQSQSANTVKELNAANTDVMKNLRASFQDAGKSLPAYFNAVTQ